MMVGAFVGWGMLGWLGGAESPERRRLVPDRVDGRRRDVRGRRVGNAIERFAYRPLRQAPRIAPLISALGVSFFLQNSVLLLYGADFRSYDTDFPIDLDRGIDWGVLRVWTIRLLAIAGAVGMMIALVLLVERTKLGKAMRATSYDREAAAMMGIDVDRVIASTFFIGWLPAGRGRARARRACLLPDQPLHGLHVRPEGIHGGGRGRYRQHPRRHARRADDRLAEAYTVGYLTSSFRDVAVFDPDPLPARPPAGDPRQAGREQGLSMSDNDARDPADRTPGGPS